MTGSADGRVEVWDLATFTAVGGPLRILAGPPADVALSPDERRFAVALTDGTVEVRDVEGRRLAHRIVAGDEPMTCVRFSPTGDMLVTCDAAGTVKLWSTDSWEPVGSPMTGHAYRWDIRVESWKRRACEVAAPGGTPRSACPE